MPIRYFSEKSRGVDRSGDPYIRETVSAYDDPRADTSEFSTKQVPTGYLEAYHYPSREFANFEGTQPVKYQPRELFTHRPASTQVTRAFMDPKISHTAPIIGAYFAKKYGELTADSTLTDYSSKLTRGAIGRNLPIKPSPINEEAESTGERRFPDMRSMAPIDPDNEIHKSEMYEAKNYLREMLGRKKPLSPQFEAHVDQPKLPGMENF